MKTLVVVGPDTIKCVNNPALIKALKELGIEMNVKLTRASFVEPDNALLRLLFHLIRKCVNDESRLAEFTRNWKCLWRVNLKPSNGPILKGRWTNRAEAIAEEVRVINESYL